MNLMYYLMNNKDIKTNDKNVKRHFAELKEKFTTSKIKIATKSKHIGNCTYFLNCLPFVDKNRDVLNKSFNVCKVRVNWKNINITDPSMIDSLLPEQYGFNIHIVDAGYARNNYQNKETYWVVFDKKEKAEKALLYFNEMFFTAIEQDCVEEYKRFKQNPAKRPLTFNALLANAYDLYDLVDKGLI